MAGVELRGALSAPGLLREARKSFERIPDEVRGRKRGLPDYLMSGLAVFGLKFPSLLQFDRGVRDDGLIRENLKHLYGVEDAPCDTALRERLDAVEPSALRGAFKRLFAVLQRGKGLEDFAWLGHYLLSVDGTGYFSSSKVRCKRCCEKHRRDGTVTYYHQMLGAVLVHPEHREVFPLAPEPIEKADGARKNDCERNAAKRLLAHVRREHPHLKLLVVEDALASNGPHVELLRSLDMRFVLGVKPDGHGELFRCVGIARTTRVFETADADGTRRRYRYANGMPLNEAHFDLEVNFLECRETRPGKRETRFSWVTDIEITEANAEALMRAGRARWRIENETFNTLKNQGYGFEHNYGHGGNHLATVFAHLMLLAFFIDQAQQRSCRLFQAAQKRAERPLYFWQKVRSLFATHILRDWGTLYGAIAFGVRPREPELLDTS